MRYLQADLADAVRLADVLAQEQFEYVVNAGGYIDHRSFADGGGALIRVHLDGLLNLLECLDRSCIARFVQLGSSDEYGSAPAPQREDARELPGSPYALAKLASTRFLQMLWQAERFPAVVLRLFLAYGPGQGADRLLPQVVRGCLEDSRFPVSEGLQLRDFCHVGDVARAVLAALTATGVDGEIINVASGAPLSIRGVIEEVRKLVGGGDPAYGQLSARAHENPRLFADVSKARTLLDWQAEIGLRDGLRATIDFYRDHERRVSA